MASKQLMMARPSKHFNYSPYPILVEVERVPVSMMATLDKRKLDGLVQGQVKNNINGQCGDRNFERLPGYIDVKVLSLDDCTSLVEEDTKLALPVCALSEPEEMQLAQYQSLLDLRAQQKQEGIHSTLKELEELIHEFNTNQSEIVKELSSIESVFSKYQQLQSALE